MTWWCSATRAPWTWTPRAYPGVWAFMAVIVALGWVAARRSGVRPERRHLLAWSAGLVALWVASDWPVGALGSGYLASAHMVQYMLYTFAAAPLMLLGVPEGVARYWLRRPRADRWSKALARPLPAALVANAVLLFTHAPWTVDTVRVTQAGSFVLDLVWLLGGLTMWWPILAPRREDRPTPLVQCVYLFLAAGLVPMVPGGFLTFAPTPLYELYELAPRVGSIDPTGDQQTAGVLMKIGNLPIVWPVIAAIFVRAARRGPDGAADDSGRTGIRASRAASSSRFRDVPRPTATAIVAVALAAAVAIGAFGDARPAAAHAQLVETTPADGSLIDAAPASVSLLFDEGMEITPDSVRVLGPDGGRVDSSSTRLSDGDRRLNVDIDGGGRGTYTVGWRGTSADGHTLTGSFVFHVEVETGAQEIDDGRPLAVALASGAGRWLGFVGLVVAIGALAMTTGISGRVAAPGRLWRLGLAAVAVAVVGTLLLLLAETATASGRGLLAAVEVLGDVGLGARTGQLIAVRAGLLAVAGGMLVAIRRDPGGLMGLALVPLAVAGLTASLGGHAWTVDVRAVAVGADALHLLAAGVWIGGLVALLVALPDQRAGDGGVAPLVRGFSRLAGAALVIVGLTGVVGGVLQVGSPEALTGTTYGRLLLVKVALFVLLGLVGWVNRTRIVPSVERLTAALGRNLKVEIAVAALLLGVTAGLVGEPPARVAIARPVDRVVVVDGVTVQVTVEPARIGENTVHLYFYDEAGMVPVAVDAVELLAETAQVPARRMEVVALSPNHFTAYGASLGAPGTWVLSVSAVIDGEVVKAAADIPIR